jgi:hypothetical protein
LFSGLPADENKRLFTQVEILSTSKSGSWLNLAKIELSAFKGQCFSGMIPDLARLKEEIRVWESHRQNKKSIFNWRLKNEDARIKLKKLYPVL